ncbi:L,D-transpeptidase family protein [Spartinivicinus ruber]|uniref:L,D-transpeptidase family protein n=1 Tax=Spartinivicinus ruber TaxID=2683272 RepID=UPI0013D174BA|nr:L,D-transpeptidase family protein [Spartinivicinus ruber]
MKFRILGLLTVGVFIILFYVFGRSIWYPIYNEITGKRTVQSAIDEYGPNARKKLETYFETAGVSYPPSEVALLAIKQSKALEVWASDGGAWKKIHTYQVQAASGKLGPKLNEGDRQVPEGVYKIEGLNPNSSYHLSLKLNYPNEYDLNWAKIEGRTTPGTNIFIHGKAVSIGCLAMGDEAIEELFVLAHATGKNNISVIISPVDPRTQELIPPQHSAAWVGDLYKTIQSAFLDITRI